VPRSKTPIISLEEVKARFEEWRQTRKGKAAIPDELWAAAAEVARREGVSRTSTELRIEWNELKRRMTAAAGLPRQTARPAVLDNNVVERALKKAILHRKNALFYKTMNGARVGDLFMSLIHTCELNRVNPFDYLTELLRHPAEVAVRPAEWMPWNCRRESTAVAA
jgi:hypothetical protein